MSRADEIFKANCRDILENGVWDTDLSVRPRWADGAPAHTVKKFGIINRYDLKSEFPILTLRRTYFKTCIDELLWIWQQKSNNIRDLRGRRRLVALVDVCHDGHAKLLLDGLEPGNALRKAWAAEAVE